MKAEKNKVINFPSRTNETVAAEIVDQNIQLMQLDENNKEHKILLSEDQLNCIMDWVKNG